MNHNQYKEKLKTLTQITVDKRELVKRTKEIILKYINQEQIIIKDCSDKILMSLKDYKVFMKEPLLNNNKINNGE